MASATFSAHHSVGYRVERNLGMLLFFGYVTSLTRRSIMPLTVPASYVRVEQIRQEILSSAPASPGSWQFLIVQRAQKHEPATSGTFKVPFD
jgi:hypothetical protein